MERPTYQDLLENYIITKECQIIEKITDARIREKLHEKYANKHIKTCRTSNTMPSPWSVENIVRKFDETEKDNPKDDLYNIVELLCLLDNI